MENNKERELPLIELEGVEFIVDIENRCLVVESNGVTKIAFSDMDYNGDHYEFKYDPTFKDLYFPFDESCTCITIQVPQRVVLDPEGMAKMYGKALDEIKGKTDFEVIVDQGLFAKRMSGQLPVIEILGHPFYVDLSIGSLRPKDDFSTEGIRFSDVSNDRSKDGRYYRLAYDPAAHQTAVLDIETITALPKGIVVIDIPTEVNLDPVSYALIHGWDMKQVLMVHPIKANITAKVVPWEETGMLTIIKENKQRSSRKKPDQPEKTAKRKKGKRL
jgi:hypothetical protein